MKMFIGSAIALVLLAPPAVRADDAKPLPAFGPIPFAAYDTNGDGVVTEQEFNAVRAQRMGQKAQEGRPMRNAASAPGFAAFDSNGDGKLTPEELAQGQQQRQQNRPGAGGGMGSGVGPGAGMARRNMPSFADYDSNGDDVITEQEFNAARAARMGERAQQGYPMRGAADAPTFADIDTNHDGRITQEEFAAHQRMRRPAASNR